MKIMCRLALQWVGVAAVAIAIPQLASAYEADGAALKLAMGPTSAPMKNQGPSRVRPTRWLRNVTQLPGLARNPTTASGTATPAPPRTEAWAGWPA